MRLRRFPSQQATIARLPHYSSTPILQFIKMTGVAIREG
jgi:hypothetical protein